MSTYNLSIISTNSGAQTLGFFSSNQPGTAVTGIQKLAERFLLELLTEQGSILYAPTRGTTFITQLKTQNFNSELDVITALHTAFMVLANNLQSEESTTDPDTERYAGAGINSVTIGKGKLTLNVFIQNNAGTVAGITIPLTLSLI